MLNKIKDRVQDITGLKARIVDNSVKANTPNIDNKLFILLKSPGLEIADLNIKRSGAGLVLIFTENK